MEPDQTYLFEAELWVYASDKAAWHFITVPEDVSRQIRFFAGMTNGFGSVRVNVRLGGTRWATSLFPDRKSGCFFLPVKAAVRKAEAFRSGDRVEVELRTG